MTRPTPSPTANAQDVTATLDWNAPLEAVLEDGTTVPVELEVALDDGDYAIVYNPSVEFEVYTPNGRAWIEPDHPVYLRNVVVVQS